jgi:hypothetical protein
MPSLLCAAIISGITNTCLDGTGGLNKIYLASFDAISASSYTLTATNVVSALPMISPYKFYDYTTNLTNAMSVDEDPVSNSDNGTLFWKQKLNFKINKRTTGNRNLIATLAPQRIVALVQEKGFGGNTGIWWIIGLTNGLYLSPDSKGTSGIKAEDQNGWSMVFSANEVVMAYEISAAAVAPIIA